MALGTILSIHTIVDNCGCWWDGVVYSVHVVGDSGIL